MSLASLPLFVRLGGRPVILLGEGEPAEAKRRLLDRAGALVVGEDAPATLAIVAIEDEDAAQAAIARLKARGILVNAVDRPAVCDFTLPAIVERGPVIIAIGTGGVSAGLAAALRQRLETLLPAEGLYAARTALRARFPDGAERRRAIGAALSPGGALDPLAEEHDVDAWLASADRPGARVEAFVLTSTDPDDLTLRQARALAAADRVYHRGDVPSAILDRARADAVRIASDSLPAEVGEGQVVDLSMAGPA